MSHEIMIEATDAQVAFYSLLTTAALVGFSLGCYGCWRSCCRQGQVMHALIFGANEPPPGYIEMQEDSDTDSSTIAVHPDAPLDIV